MLRSIQRVDYWRVTRKAEVSFVLVTPLWFVYEILAFRLNHGWSGSFRTGTDFLLKKIFNYLGVHALFSDIAILVILISFFLYKIEYIRKLSKKPKLFAYMIMESLIYAIIFGLIVSGVTAIFLSQKDVAINQTRVSALIVHIGSGVYEEFFFRFLFISGFVKFFTRVIREYQKTIYSFAIIISSILFALFHYFYYFNESFYWHSFLFRFIAGIAFSLLFIARGYGITAYSHSLYNILLMFR